jgi:hypothetical protein
MKKIRYITIGLLLIAYTSCFAQVIKGTYAIKNTETGMLLRIKDANKNDGIPLVAYAPVNWKCMTWDFKHTGGQAYQLRNLFTNKTFQPIAANSVEGTNLEQSPLIENNADQQYEFIPVDKDYYLIKLKDRDLYLTADSKGGINAPVTLSKKGNSKLQYWSIYEQHPEM